MRFAPGIDIRIHLERILRHFEILDFFDIFICGFTKIRPRRNFLWGSKFRNNIENFLNE